MTFTYDAIVDVAYFAVNKPISSTICEEINLGVITEFDATNMLVGVELIGVRDLHHIDLSPLKRFLSWETYLELLENVANIKFANVNNP